MVGEFRQSSSQTLSAGKTIKTSNTSVCVYIVPLELRTGTNSRMVAGATHRSLAFGELTDYHLFYLRTRCKPERLRVMWGEELTGPDDVFHVFECYITGEKNRNGVKVSE